MADAVHPSDDKPDKATSRDTSTPRDLRKRGERGGKGQGGGTVRPIYGERRPMMYHLMESEMKRVSSLSGHALAWFSVGAFILSLCANVVLSSVVATRPLTEIEELLFKWGPFVTGGLGALCYVIGAFYVCAKHGDIEQVKAETVSNEEIVRVRA